VYDNKNNDETSIHYDASKAPDASAWRRLPRRFGMSSDVVSSFCVDIRAYPAAAGMVPMLGYSLALDKRLTSHDNELPTSAGENAQLAAFKMFKERFKDVLHKHDSLFKHVKRGAHACAQVNNLPKNCWIPCTDVRCLGFAIEVNCLAIAMARAMPAGFMPFDVHIFYADKETAAQNQENTSIRSEAGHGVTHAAFAELYTTLEYAKGITSGTNDSKLIAKSVHLEPTQAMHLPTDCVSSTNQCIVCVRFWHISNPRADCLNVI